MVIVNLIGKVAKTLCFLSVTTQLMAAPQTAIEALIQQYIPDAHVGIYVQRTDTQEVIIDLNGSQHFTPASTAKLFTSYAALKILGPEFTFNTDFYHTPQGEIFITFSGDPTLGQLQFDVFASKLAQAGTQTIHGPGYFNISSVPAPYYARGWTQDDLNWYYAMPVAAANIDQNVVHVTLTTGDAPGLPTTARVMTQPPVPLSNFLRTATATEATQTCQLNASVDSTNHITLYGCWPISKDPVNLYFAIANPLERASATLKQALEKHRIAFSGDIKEAPAPKQIQPTYRYTSPSLTTLLTSILSDSNNLYAEALNKQIGQKTYGFATFQAGAQAIEALIEPMLKLPENAIQLFDGSGLSVYNVTTPAALGMLLTAALHDEAVASYWLPAMAISGKSGTLTKRLNTEALTGHFVGKSGTMNHVFNLAGYLYRTPDQPPLVVVLLINQTRASKEQLQAFENAVMMTLLQ